MPPKKSVRSQTRRKNQTRDGTNKRRQPATQQQRNQNERRPIAAHDPETEAERRNEGIPQEAIENESGDSNVVPPVNIAEVMVRQTQLLEVISREQQSNHGNSSRMTEFMKLRPPVYDSADDDPLAADDWLKTITKKLDLVAVSDQEKVMLSTHQLIGAAGEWWDNYKETITELDDITWDGFQRAFREYHIPEGVMDIKADEFRTLKQESMTVNEYIRKFMKLARYAPDEVNTDQKKQNRFKKGLNHTLRILLAAHIYPDFNTLMNQAIILEGALIDQEKDEGHKSLPYEPKGKNEQESPQQRDPRNQKATQYHTPGARQQQSTQPYGNQSTTGQSRGNPHVPRPSNKVRACYHCKEPGHMIASCPYYKQGPLIPASARANNTVSSMGQGTSQTSKKRRRNRSFGQERISHDRFVAEYPGAATEDKE